MEKYRDFSYTPIPTHTQLFPQYPYHPSGCIFVILLLPGVSVVYVRTHGQCLYSILQNVSTMTYIHHYSIIRNNFTVLKLLCTLPIYPLFFPPQPQQPLIFLQFHGGTFIRLSYHQNHIVCALFLWILSVSNIHISFLHFFLLTHFFLFWIDILLSRCSSLSTSWVFISFRNYE